MPNEAGGDDTTAIPGEPVSGGDQTWSTWARAEPPTRPTWLDEPVAVTPPLAEDPLGPPPAPPYGTLPPAGAVPSGDGLPPRRDSRPTTGPTWLKAALVGGLVGAVVASVLSFGLVRAFDHDGGSVAKPVAVSRASSKLGGAQLDIRGVLEAVRPGVVSIQETGSSPGAGSGMVIESDGLVLTNAHVVNGATSIVVTLQNGDRKQADLVGSFPDNDVALIRIRGVKDLPTVTLGSSDAMQVGDEVVAVGNALDLGAEPTVTRGIVSAVKRSLQIRSEQDNHLITLQNLVQTDAAINPGNSGGPLVNARGEVVGVNTVVATEGQNIGFALAIDSIKPLIQGIKDGKATVTLGPLLGVSTTSINAVTPQVLTRFGINRNDGAFIQSVAADSGADQAGLQPGDVITAVDGDRVRSADDVGNLIAKHQPGDVVTITYERGGAQQSTKATLGSREVTQGGG